jgi:hypothetical protein
LNFGFTIYDFGFTILDFLPAVGFLTAEALAKAVPEEGRFFARSSFCRIVFMELTMIASNSSASL